MLAAEGFESLLPTWDSLDSIAAAVDEVLRQHRRPHLRIDQQRRLRSARRGRISELWRYAPSLKNQRIRYPGTDQSHPAGHAPTQRRAASSRSDKLLGIGVSPIAAPTAPRSLRWRRSGHDARLELRDITNIHLSLIGSGADHQPVSRQRLSGLPDAHRQNPQRRDYYERVNAASAAPGLCPSRCRLRGGTCERHPRTFCAPAEAALPRDLSFTSVHLAAAPSCPDARSTGSWLR